MELDQPERETMKAAPAHQSSGQPPAQGTPAAPFNDQMQIMQSLMEVQKDLVKLSGSVDRLQKDVEKTSAQIEAFSSKVSRFEGFTACAGIALVLFAGFAWFVFGDKITQIKDQLFQYQQKVEAIAPPK